jgi:hypothetical protein
MRTTLTIDDDVLRAARARAEAERRPVGAVISDLARQAMKRGPAAGAEDSPTGVAAPRMRNGIPLLPARFGHQPVTLDIVKQLRDELD